MVFMNAHNNLMFLIRPFTFSGSMIQYSTRPSVQFQKTIQDCYKLLGVSSSCTDNELKEAYTSLARLHHPDSNSEHVDAGRFSQIADAYKTLEKYRESCLEYEEDDELKGALEFDIKHTAPQHRQYITYEGKGYGTPSMRERQYRQFQAERATENAFEYKTSKLSYSLERDALVAKVKQEAKKNMIRNAMDRLVEDLIQESMAKGEFNDLPGSGKPLKYEHNPMVDTMTHQLNKMMINNGYAPTWVTAHKEIKEMFSTAVHNLRCACVKRYREEDCSTRDQSWSIAVQDFCMTVDNVNKKVARYNLMTPTMQQQVMPFSSDNEIHKVELWFQDLLDSDELCSFEEKHINSQSNMLSSKEPYAFNPADKISLKTVFKEIRALFAS